MKKTALLAVFIFFALCLTPDTSCAEPVSSPDFSGGRGTKNDPYIIANLVDLVGIPDRIFNNPTNPDGLSYRSAHYRQTADIDAAAISGWVPIGFAAFSDFGDVITDVSFCGVYDGGGYKIIDLHVEADRSIPDLLHYGLFGVVSGDGINSGIIKNLRLDNVLLHYRHEESRAFCGGIVGRMINGRIENCALLGGVIAAESRTPRGQGTASAGGLAGWVHNGTIINCNNSATVQSLADTSFSYCGGIAGFVEKGDVTNCSNSGTVNAFGGVNTVGNHASGGGIVGYTWFGRADKCFNYGPVSNDSTGSNVLGGGIFGGASSGVVTGCSNEGDVDVISGSHSCFAGGIIGVMWPDRTPTAITNSVNRGKISTHDSSHYATDGRAGGIVGAMHLGTIRTSFNEGPVSVTAEIASVGGIAGSVTSGSIEDTGNRADVTAYLSNGSPSTMKARAGGVVGVSHADVVGASVTEFKAIRLFNMGRVVVSTDIEPRQSAGYALIGHSENIRQVSMAGSRWLDGAGLEPNPKMKDEEAIAISSKDFADKESFALWDFNDVWTIDSGSPTPHPIPRGLPGREE